MELTLKEAWADFIFDLHKSGKWETLTRTERQYIDKANREIKRDMHPVRKVAGLFRLHAPGVYNLDKITFKKAQVNANVDQ